MFVYLSQSFIIKIKSFYIGGNSSNEPRFNITIIFFLVINIHIQLVNYFFFAYSFVWFQLKSDISGFLMQILFSRDEMSITAYIFLCRYSIIRRSDKKHTNIDHAWLGTSIVFCQTKANKLFKLSAIFAKNLYVLWMSINHLHICKYSHVYFTVHFTSSKGYVPDLSLLWCFRLIWITNAVL